MNSSFGEIMSNDEVVQFEQRLQSSTSQHTDHTQLTPIKLKNLANKHNDMTFDHGSQNGSQQFNQTRNLNDNFDDNILQETPDMINYNHHINYCNKIENNLKYQQSDDKIISKSQLNDEEEEQHNEIVKQVKRQLFSEQKPQQNGKNNNIKQNQNLTLDNDNMRQSKIIMNQTDQDDILKIADKFAKAVNENQSYNLKSSNSTTNHQLLTTSNTFSKFETPYTYNDSNQQQQLQQMRLEDLQTSKSIVGDINQSSNNVNKYQNKQQEQYQQQQEEQIFSSSDKFRRDFTNQNSLVLIGGVSLTTKQSQKLSPIQLRESIRTEFLRTLTPVRLRETSYTNNGSIRQSRNNFNQMHMTTSISRISQDPYDNHSQISQNNIIETKQHSQINTINTEKQLIQRSKSQLFCYSSQKDRDTSQTKNKSLISQLHPKDQKLSIDYFLGTAQKQQQFLKKQFTDKVTNVLYDLQQLNENEFNAQHIINNLKVIFFEHSQFVEGGTMGSTIQPINSNLMNLYLFHQFLKRYELVYDPAQSNEFEMIFLNQCNKKTKKLNFNQFGSVLAKISMKIYGKQYDQKQLEMLEPVDFLLKIIDDFLFSINNNNNNNNQDTTQNDHQDRQNQQDTQQQLTQQQNTTVYQNPIDNDFENYKQQYYSTIAQKSLQKHHQQLKQIFDQYAKASKRGVKIIPLRQFKWMLRDLSIIPHITTEYKCGQLFKYLDTQKLTDNKQYPEEIFTLQTFPFSMYIIFSLTLEDETEIGQKVKFIIKWLKEHAKNKLAGVHAIREDRRLKFTNEKLQQQSALKSTR